MVKIIHYEVYANRGDGWKLVDQFSGDQRQDAVNLAKEIESSEQVAVKIIREIFDVQDNSYQESVEYVGGLSRKKKNTKPSNMFNNFSGEYNVVYEKTDNEKNSERSSVVSAVLKLVAIILLSLLLSNIVVTLLEPVIEVLVPEDERKKVMFITFFVLFILITVPLILKKVPWTAFYAHNERKKVINEKRFFNKAQAIIRRYNLNDEYEDVITPVYPEAPLEHKRYIVDFLTQILGNLDAQISMHDSFTRLGVKLIVFGGCLELSRYCGLRMSEANSLLYEAFKILDGDNPDLVAFYEAKRTYRDNKVAVFLTGVGAYLMAQVIKYEKMEAYIINATLSKWIALNNQPEPIPATEDTSEDNHLLQEKDIMLRCIASVKNNINFYDDENEVSEDKTIDVSSQLRNIMANLVSKWEGENVIEADNITSVEFPKLNNAIKFVIDLQQDIEAFKEQNSESGLILDNKSCVLEMPTEDEPNLSPYLADVFEQTYNNEIIVNDVIKDELTDSRYEFEFLGEKKLSRSGKTATLYKLAAKQ